MNRARASKDRPTEGFDVRRPVRPAVLSLALCALLVLHVPLIFLMIESFRNSQGTWSFEWYGKVFQNEDILRSLGRSFEVGLWSASVSTVIGLFGALALKQWDPSGHFHEIA